MVLKPIALQVGDRFRYVGSFDTYCNVDISRYDPRGFDRVLLFVFGSSRRVMPLSLAATADVELIWRCDGTARMDDLPTSFELEELVHARKEHFEFFSKPS